MFPDYDSVDINDEYDSTAKILEEFRRIPKLKFYYGYITSKEINKIDEIIEHNNNESSDNHDDIDEKIIHYNNDDDKVKNLTKLKKK